MKTAWSVKDTTKSQKLQLHKGPLVAGSKSQSLLIDAHIEKYIMIKIWYKNSFDPYS